MIPDTYIIEDEDEPDDILDSTVLREIEEEQFRKKRMGEIKTELAGKKLSQEGLVKGISQLEQELESLAELD